MSPEKISVIITCYNQGNYLDKAVNSVLMQSYPHFEIVVIDDGSTDRTKEVAQKYSYVKYVYKTNQGVSAARNTGIQESEGSLLVFLDADDWLVPDALAINLNYLQQNPEVAFVAGTYKEYYDLDNKSVLIQEKLDKSYYCHLLQKNFIGMHATVLYRRWIFEIFKYDITLTGCEDYDLFLKIARQFPIFSHTKLIAIYRKHQTNTSSNYGLMLDSALLVLNRQKKHLLNKTEKQYLKKGIKFWKSYYYQKAIDKYTQKTHKRISIEKILELKPYKRHLYLEFIFYVVKLNIRASIKRSFKVFEFIKIKE